MSLLTSRDSVFLQLSLRDITKLSRSENVICKYISLKCSIKGLNLMTKHFHIVIDLLQVVIIVIIQFIICNEGNFMYFDLILLLLLLLLLLLFLLLLLLLVIIIIIIIIIIIEWRLYIYSAGKSFSVVKWPWFCKWKTLALPIRLLELIINKTKLPKIAWPSPFKLA